MRMGSSRNEAGAGGGDRTAHINRVLRSIRKVHRVIGTGERPEDVIQRIALLLVDECGYRACYVHVPAGSEVPALRGAAGDGGLAAILGELDAAGLIPGCMHEALASGQVVTRHAHDPACGGCPVTSRIGPTDEAIALPLRMDPTRCGALLVVFHAGELGDDEEAALLHEVAEDVALGLRTLEAEHRARAQESLYRSVFETMTEGLLLADLTRDASGEISGLQVVDVNPAFERHMGQSRAAVKGKSMREVFGATAHRPPYEAALAGEPQTYRVHNAQLGRHFRITLTALDATRLSFVFDDVTEREEMMAALAESERRYRVVTDNVSDAIWIFDVDERRITYTSPSIERLRGYTAAESLEQDLSQMLTPASYEEMMGKLAHRLDAFRAGERGVYVDLVEQPRKDGGVVLTEVTTRFHVDAASGKLEIFGCSRDITQRVQAEREARATAQRFERVVEHIPDGLLLFDSALRLQYVNAASCRMSKRPLGDFIGCHMSEVWSGENLEVVRGVVEKATAECKAATAEREVHMAGAMHHVVVTCIPLLDDARELVQLVILVSDRSDTHRAEQALRDQLAVHAQLAKVGASVPGAIVAFELREGRMSFVFATPAIAEIYGLPLATVMGDWDAAASRLGPDRARVRASLSESARNLSPWHDAYRYDHPTKGERWLEAWAIPERHPDGAVEWHGFIKDGSDRRSVERRAARMTSMYQALSDTNEAIVRATSERQLFERVCSIVERIPGCAVVWIGVPDAARTKLLRVATAGPLAPRVGEPELRLAADPTSTEQPLICQAFSQDRVLHRNDLTTTSLPSVHGTPSGSAIGLPLRRTGRAVAAFGVIATEGGYFDEEMVKLFEAMALDISFGLEAMAGTAALRASEERYRSLVENLEDIVFTVDLKGSFVLVSGSIARFGFTREELIARPLFQHVHPDDALMAEAALDDVRRGQPSTIDIRLNDAAGRTRFLRVSMRPALDGAIIRGAHGVMTDRTRQHETEEQLRLSQKMEAVGRLAGGVAHDFNNLLCVIGTYTDLALDAVPESDPLHQDLTEIRLASSRAEALTRQLLAFGRKQLMQPVIFDLNGLVSGLEKMLGRLIGEDVELTVVRGEGLGRTKADPGQIEQVLMNLVVNARDALPKGGSIVIQTENVNLHGDEASAVPAGAYVCLSVSDTGIGMDERTQRRIFEPFFTTKGAGKGTGLGLAMVYGIVKQSGGCIEVESELDVGSTFRIYLPRIAGAEVSARPSATGRTLRSRGGQETILVVEDEESLRKIVARVLTGAGYRVVSASNAGEALLLCEKHGSRIRLMLTDVIMPGMNGRELSERLATMVPNMKVLYMSGYTDDAIVDRGALAPGTVLIQKPFTADELSARVRAVLDDTEGKIPAIS
jgi:two-component system, cell cycle sensor histidine kinase and response regulator CckA